MFVYKNENERDITSHIMACHYHQGYIRISSHFLFISFVKGTVFFIILIFTIYSKNWVLNVSHLRFKP